MEEAKIFGMKMSSAVTILCILVVLLIILIIFIIHKMNVMARKYEMLMSGKKGADLEKIIRIRFKEMDQVKANARRVTKEHRQIKKHLSSCISKYALVKYDAFDKMAGKLSFVIALLNDENSGILLNSMHSREGCFTYAKEIVNGESYIQLSSEEKEALEQAKTVEEEIQDMTKEALGAEYTDYNLVVAGPLGMPTEQSTINGALKRLIEKNNLPKVVFHSFRHSSITYKLKLNGGDIKAVQGDSGHAQASMVTEQYAHILDDDRRLNAQRFDDFFYQHHGAEPEMPHQTAQSIPENSAVDADAAAALTKLLANPSMAELIKNLAKNL